MIKSKLAAIQVALVLLFACAFHLRADFSYQQTSRMTGGSLLKYASMIGGRLTQPVTATVSIKGGKMAYITPHSGSIIDLQAKTVTTFNVDRKTFSSMTFDELKHSMDNVSDPNGATVSDFHVNLTDGSDLRTILDKETHEKIVTVLMTVADSSGNKADTRMDSHLFHSPDVEGVKELLSFYSHLKDLPWSPAVEGLDRPEIAKAMSGIYTKLFELEGLPLMSITTISGSVPGIPSGMSDLPSGTQSAQGGPAGVLGGRLGGLATAMARRRDMQQNGTSDTDTAGNGSSRPLLELTTTVTTYSTKPVNPSVFQIPAGFAQTEPALSSR